MVAGSKGLLTIPPPVCAGDGARGARLHAGWQQHAPMPRAASQCSTVAARHPPAAIRQAIMLFLRSIGQAGKHVARDATCRGNT